MDHRVDRGTLLLEVLLGFGIFLTALLLAFGVFPNSAKATTLSRNYTIARALARDHLERELTKSYISMAPSATSEIKLVTNNGVQVEKNFEIDVAVVVLDDRGAGDPFDRKHIKVTVTWNLSSDSRREVFLESWATQ